ncbi:MAG: nuclear transport factor 2 family protein [Saprospiraceae bacterium]|nr:nuclear transport factor 2 family protein [Saprospiraceae bacterium]
MITRTCILLLLTSWMPTLFIVAQDNISCEALKKLVLIDAAIWNERTAERLGEVYHQDCVDAGYYEGLQERIEATKRTLAENPKLYVKIKDIICANNAVTVHYESSGYSAKYGSEFRTTGMYTAHIKDGKYWKMNGQLDILSPLLAAGYTLTPPDSDRGLLLKIAKIDEEIWNTGNVDLCHQIYAENYREYNEGKLEHEGIEGRKQNVRSVKAANENFTILYKEILLGENTMTICWEASGYSKQYQIDFVLRSVSTDYIKDGKIYRAETMRDMLGALSEGGYSLSPPKK